MGAQSHAGLRASAAKRERSSTAARNQQKLALIRSASDNRAAAIRRHWADDKDPTWG